MTTKFMVEYTNKDIMDKLELIYTETAKTNGSPKISLDYLLTQFYQSEFKDDMQSMITAQKGIKIEPFVHKTDEQINLLPVMKEDKIAKFYFNEWWTSLDKNDILLKDTDKLKSEFNTYLKTKNIDDGQEV